jgi:hypothetical protein
MTPGIDLRFLARVDPDLLRHPMVVEGGRCPFCGCVAPAHAVGHRQRRVIEVIVAAETETFDRPVHGAVLELLLPPFVGCGHMNVLPLPLWVTRDHRCYYARQRRTWEPA